MTDPRSEVEAIRDEHLQRTHGVGDYDPVNCGVCAALASLEARLNKARGALTAIARPPFMWDSPESRDTNEVRVRCRIARDALASITDPEGGDKE